MNNNNLREKMFLKEASQIRSGLSRQMVKVESMSDSVHNWK